MMLRARTAARPWPGSENATPAHATGRPRRTLIIGIDAIPYRLVRDMVANGPGIFDQLRGPTALSSTFPSISDTAWSSLLGPLGSTRPRGYESRYFDAAGRKLRGGWGLTETRASWKETFDWKMHGLVHAAFAYGLPRRYSMLELRKGLRAFAASASDIFSMYIVSTDGLAHLRGPEGLAEALKCVDAELKRFRARHPDMPFNTVLLSDHGIAGGEPLVNCWPAIRREVCRSGFRIRHRLVKDGDVVFNPYGLITDFVLYSRSGTRRALAEIVARTPGVELAAIRLADDAWQLYGKQARALIERRWDGKECVWRYRPETGDPLGYKNVAARLAERRGEEASQWFPDRWWFEGSARSFYPDALYRLARSFELADAPASVVCSCAPGYMFGGRIAERIARMTVGRLRWSHGALHRDASLGFMMSDLPGWNAPEMVRAEEALTCLTAERVALPTVRSHE